jgi:hypothetical protein
MISSCGRMIITPVMAGFLIPDYSQNLPSEHAKSKFPLIPINLFHFIKQNY